MRKEDFDACRRWFAGYTGGFLSGSEDDRRNISLKIEHTHCVCDNILFIAAAEHSDASDAPLAGTVGLFHDVGRFEQYRRFGTFLDRASVNHGKLGAEVLEKQGILNALPGSDRELILDCVRFHNAFAAPSALNARTRFFLNMVRDADKLDIWRVFAELDAAPPEERARAALLGLPERPGVSPAVIDSLMKRTSASMADIRSVNDFKAMQLSWVFDLNFPSSFVLLRRQGHFGRIAASLPDTEDVNETRASIRRFLDEQTSI